MKRNLPTIICATAALIGACAAQDEYSLVSDMNESTGISMTMPKEPARLAASRPGLSVTGKDYLFAGPVSISGDGVPQNYIWFATGSTIDRRITNAPQPTFDTIVMLVDGTPMTFDLVPWLSAGKSEPYELPVNMTASYAAKITTSQIRQLANAQKIEAYVTDDNSRSPLYSLMKGARQDWLDFCCDTGFSASAIE